MSASDEARDMVAVAGLFGVLERHLGLAVRFAPRARRGGGCRRRARLAPTQLGAQQIAEQVVVPVPLAVAVERHEEQVRALERVEHRSADRCDAEHGVAERPAHPVEHRRPSEERDVGCREVRQELGTEVVGEQPVVAGERRAAAGVGAARRSASAAR